MVIETTNFGFSSASKKSQVWVGTGWKMNMLLDEAVVYSRTLRSYLQENPFPGNIFLVPPFTALSTVCKTVAESQILVGAQNAHWEQGGAFTGEISCPMIADCGATIVEIGHSERRRDFGETDLTVNLKVLAAIRNNLCPLICIGDSAVEKSKGDAKNVIKNQVLSAVKDISPSESSSIIFAYEPVWAIGEGAQPASVEVVGEITSFVRQLLKNFFGSHYSGQIPVLYGGSVNIENAVSYLLHSEVDGLFIGRAAWKVEGFIKIIHALEGAIEK